MANLIRIVLLLTYILICCTCCLASLGDVSFIYNKCLYRCAHVNCSHPAKFESTQPVYLKLLQWDCDSECRYTCMWVTVDAFNKDGLKIPQFHGKWPFVRLYGIQEPASVFFSICNALCALGIFYLRKKISSSVPMYYVWHVVSIISLNAWIWSIVFHTRDTDLTERLDYYFAFSVVCCNIWAFICRVFVNCGMWKKVILTMSLIFIYLHHVYYLHFVKMDYGYNMKVNITLGVINTSVWTIWSLTRLRKQRYVWKCLVVVLSVTMLLSLELLDFPPIYWCVDAHALWHAGTVPFALLWISFAIDDCKYLREELEKMPMKLD